MHFTENKQILKLLVESITPNNRLEYTNRYEVK